MLFNANKLTIIKFFNLTVTMSVSTYIASNNLIKYIINYFCYFFVHNSKHTFIDTVAIIETVCVTI